MSTQLFAFRVARPVEPFMQEVSEETYDPEMQTMVWQGGTEAFARHTGYYCTHNCRGYRYCENPYGPDGCDVWGRIGYWGCERSYYCDFR